MIMWKPTLFKSLKEDQAFVLTPDPTTLYVKIKPVLVSNSGEYKSYNCMHIGNKHYLVHVCDESEVVPVKLLIQLEYVR